MRLISVEMTNWKCFEHKKVDFDLHTFLNWSNGVGKTTVIEAVVLALFNKRPANLDFESLVDITKPTKIVLTFSHNAAEYVVEREVGKTSAYRVFKDGELISRTSVESRDILAKIIPESVLTSLWGYAPLGESKVLNTSYLLDILNDEFKEPLDLKEYFNKEKTYNQKRKSSLEKEINNQDITQADVDALQAELADIEAKIREKAFVSDNDVIRAKRAKEDFARYQALMAELPKEQPPYPRDLCKKLQVYGTSKAAWAEYFRQVHEELDVEKKKSIASPLTRYPRNVISQLISESKCNNNKCLLCGGEFHEPTIDYDTIDSAKIQRLEKILEDEQYSFVDFAKSVKYWSTMKQIDQVAYAKDVDFERILNNYNQETNNLYARYEQLKKQVSASDKELSKVNELLTATKEYDDSKACIAIVEEYIKEAKEYYADSIIRRASELVRTINPRYVDLFIENGIYKAKIWNEDFSKLSTLAIQSLSNGEKTCAALSLILAIRDLFMPGLPLVMDESFVNLDANNLAAIKKIIREDKNQWVIVSHDERLIG